MIFKKNTVDLRRMRRAAVGAKPPMRATEPKAAGFSSYGQRNLRKLSGFGQIAVQVKSHFFYDL